MFHSPFMPSTLDRPHACSRHLRLEYRPSIPPLALSITIISLPFYSPPTPAPPLAPSPNDATTHGTRRVSPPLPHPVSHSRPPLPGRPLCRLRIPFLPAHTMPPPPTPAQRRHRARASSTRTAPWRSRPANDSPRAHATGRAHALLPYIRGHALPAFGVSFVRAPSPSGRR